jgi:hypothetical protein
VLVASQPARQALEGADRAAEGRRVFRTSRLGCADWAATELAGCEGQQLVGDSTVELERQRRSYILCTRRRRREYVPDELEEEE